MRMPHGRQPLRAPLEEARGLVRGSDLVYKFLAFPCSFLRRHVVQLRPRLAQDLKTSEKQEDDHNDESETDAPSRAIAPISAVRPPRPCSKQCQNQYDNQYSSKHCCSFLSEVSLDIRTLCSSGGSPTYSSLEPSLRLVPRYIHPRQTVSSEIDGDCNSFARIVRVVHVIPAVHVIDVDVVGVVPVCRPRLNKSEPIAAILEARISADQNWTAHVELVSAAKMGAKAIIRYATFASGAESQGWL